MIPTTPKAIAMKKFPMLKQNNKVPIFFQPPITPLNPNKINNELITYNAVIIPYSGFDLFRRKKYPYNIIQSSKI